MNRRPDWRIRFLAAALVLAVGLGVLAGAWLVGAVGRVKVRRTSPDGRLEVACRARLPESTEYELYLRRSWQPFGTYLAHSGTESMGRCRDVVWSPDSTLVLVVNEGNSVVVVDVAARRQLAVQSRFAPGDSWDYTSRRIITSLRFASPQDLEFDHCDRLRLPTSGDGDFSRCGRDIRQGRARLTRTGSAASFSIRPSL